MLSKLHRSTRCILYNRHSSVIRRCFASSSVVELEDSSKLLQNQQHNDILEKADQDGYIFLRNLIPAEQILNLRRDIVKILHEYNWIDAEQDDVKYGAKCTNIKPKIEAIEDAAYWPVFDEIQSLESFHRLSHNENLITFLNKLFSPDTTLIHPRNIFRILFPKHNYWKTPAHQDWVYIQGTKNVWTSWIPIGNVDRNMGPLSVLIGSHKYGVFPVIKCEGAGGVAIDEKLIEKELVSKGCKWGTTDFKIGDVLLFDSWNIHKGTDNNTDELRISCDFRYQPLNEEVVKGSLLPHWGRKKWDEIYSNWSDSDIQYYWKTYNLKLVEFDPSVTGNDQTGAGDRPLLRQYQKQ